MHVRFRQVGLKRVAQLEQAARAKHELRRTDENTVISAEEPAAGNGPGIAWSDSCDTMVALGSSTLGGNTIFAKNSDRPQEEAQPLVLVPAGAHAAGGHARAWFVDVPPVATTVRRAGPKPSWCSG